MSVNSWIKEFEKLGYEVVELSAYYKGEKNYERISVRLNQTYDTYEFDINEDKKTVGICCYEK